MSLSNILKKISSRPYRALAGIVLVSFLIGIFVLRDLGAGNHQRNNEKTFTVHRENLVKSLSVTGVISPGKVIAVNAPTGGYIKNRSFEIGDEVKEGEKLIEIDVTELDSQINDAESAVLKASLTMKDYENWASGTEVLRVRAGVSAAKMSLEDAQRKLGETKTLFDRGIIPRVEYEAAEQLQKTKTMQLEMAQQDALAALKRGGKEYRQIAQLELANAKSRLNKLIAARDSHTIRAPVSGTTLPSSENVTNSSNPNYSPVGLGGRVSSGQSLFRIAQFDDLTVIGAVSEIDVVRLKVGMPVDISGDAFPNVLLRGELVKIASQATYSSAGQRIPSFEVTASIKKIKAKVIEHLRIGMSAQLSIKVYENPAALVIPVDFLNPVEKQFYVWVKRNGDVTKQNVTAGTSTPAGVEVLSGLAENDVIVGWKKKSTDLMP